MNEEKGAQMDLDQALNKQETFWKEKARLNWHVNGDRNTSFFHRVTKIKNKTKVISSIRNEEEIITDPQRITNHVVNYYKNLFSYNFVLQDSLLVEEVIPTLIDNQTNRLLTMISSTDEIKGVVFGLNSEGAPNPDGFGACFFHTYWEIVKEDVTIVVLQFFNTGWLLPHFNANSLVLILKNPNADIIDQYRPTALANFKFKIISNVIADRIANILPTVIFAEQRGFIKGRNIKDCIALASEAINVLDKRSFGGNFALKIDVSKAFDAVNWEFLLKVLTCFGFNHTICNWIRAIHHSANVSICINGSQEGYFKCKRGVRQGDPLSPLLFCIAEEVLSRGIKKLVSENKLDLISASRTAKLPSHCFYADDLMVYCKGKI